MMWVWLAIFIVLAVLEGVTYSLVSVWFCFGAVAGLIAAALGAPLWAQIICCVLCGALTLFILRPYFKKKLITKPEKTNLERLAGMKALVIEEVNELSGAVKAEGTEWNARTYSEHALPAGTQCIIVRLDGNKLIVAPIL